MSDPSGTTPLDLEVQELVKAGREREAMDLILTRLSPELRPFLHRLLGDASLVDAALSMTCERLWLGLSQFRWQYSIRSWSYIFARREANRCRASRAATKSPSPASVFEPGPMVDTLSTTGGSITNHNWLDPLRASMSDDDRDLIVLRVERGLTWKEVAAAFIDDDTPSAEAIQREAARLRQRYQAIRAKLATALTERDERNRSSGRDT